MINIDTHLLNTQSKTSSSLSKQRIFGIHGGGNIGLGCMADIVTRSHYNYHIIATSSDKFSNALINSNHLFWLRHGREKADTCVRNITMVNAKNQDHIEALYCQADILAICLTEKAFMSLAYNIAKALLARFKNNDSEMPILILMNRLNSKEFVEKEINRALMALTKEQRLTNQILKKVQWIPTVVDRIVSKIDKKSILTQVRNHLMTLNKQQLSKLDIIPDSEKSLEQTIDKILVDNEQVIKLIAKLNFPFTLFNAEQDFSLYVPNSFSKASHFPDLKVVENLDQFAEIKNKYINGPHATLAWIGGLMGCSTISEAINNPSMLWFVNNLMEREIGPILKAEYPNLKNSDLKLLKTSFIKRCKASADDPIVRVGRDPLRKLQRGGRIQGVIELKQKHGLTIATPELERGMAAGILYAIKKVDPHNEECQKIHEIYQQKGSYQAVLCYKGPNDNDIYPGLDSKLDKNLITNILKRISLFERIYKIRRTRILNSKKLHHEKHKH